MDDGLRVQPHIDIEVAGAAGSLAYQLADLSTEEVPETGPNSSINHSFYFQVSEVRY